MKAPKRRSKWLPFLVALLFASTMQADAQLVLIEIEKPFTAHSLSGTVIGPDGLPIAGAVVEECDAPFAPIEVKSANGEPTGTVLHGDCTREPNRIISSTVTNLGGHFHLPSAKAGKAHYLHISSPGFDPMQITVMLKFFVGARLRIQLHIAT